MPDPIEEFFGGYAPEMQAISQKLRALVKSAMPETHEILVARQNHVGYSFSGSMRDRICYICPMQDYVRLGFDYGTHLADPGQLIEGSGLRMRHVKVRTLEAARQPALAALVEGA